MGERWKEVDTMTSVVIAHDKPRPHQQPDACIVHVSEGNSFTRTRVLDTKMLSVGRAPECSIVISCSHISRVHAHIIKDGSNWVVENKSSVNGIYINGVREERKVLQFGDRIDLGRGEILLFRPYDSDYQQALEAQKLESLGRLASGIAHDFNNVLMAIVGAATCLQDDIAAGDVSSVDDTIDDMITASQRGADLARQLLSFARKGEDANSVVEVEGLVREVTRLVERTFDQRIRVSTEINTDVAVVADRSQLTQVLMNLCINARDAMPHGGELSVRVYDGAPSTGNRLGTFVCIEVQDTGIGMSPEVRDRIFEPFFSTKGEGRGTGLGLATTYGIIRHYGGAIEVESREGFGTKLSVYLPAQDGATGEWQASGENLTQAIAPKGRGRKILLAEDQTLVRRHTARMLKKMGFEVVEANDGVEAVQAVEGQPDSISLVMLDLQMPRRSGDEACRMIQALDEDLPILMVSGNVEDPRIAALADGELVDVLSKPYSQDELALALMRAR